MVILAVLKPIETNPTHGALRICPRFQQRRELVVRRLQRHGGPLFRQARQRAQARHVQVGERPRERQRRRQRAGQFASAQVQQSLAGAGFERCADADLPSTIGLNVISRLCRLRAKRLSISAAGMLCPP